jgi:tetratricopeptide (TPR) repeat protein
MAGAKDAAALALMTDSFWDFSVRFIEQLGVTCPEETPLVRADRKRALRRALTECQIGPGWGSPDVLPLYSRIAASLPESSPWRPVLADAVTVMVQTLTNTGGNNAHLSPLSRLGGPGGIIDTAVPAMREIVTMTTRDDTRLPIRLDALSSALLARFEWRGDLRDLHRVVATRRAAVRISPSLYRQANLSFAWVHLAERTGNDRLLSAALDLMREVAERVAENDPQRAIVLHKYGLALMSRFERTRDGADLDLSITVLYKALAAYGRFTSAERVEREQVIRAVLAGALNNRYEHQDDADSLDEAIRIGRSGITPGKPVRDVPGEMPIRWSLSASLITLGRRKSDTAALREALGILTDLLTLDLPIVEHSRIMANTGLARIALWRIAPDTAELGRAVNDFREAAGCLAPSDPDLVRHRRDLGRALQDRFKAEKDPAYLDAAVEQYRLAAEQENGPTLERIRAAYDWGRALADAKDWSRALTGFSLAVDLLPEMVLEWLPPADRMKTLGQLYELPSAAAGCALHAARWPECRRSPVARTRTCGDG